jgi:2-C-methyl-D-erythritol 4-phosphate cytidylyltransferase / 2-C-methyl-D-erythritol 2,4-cyclodiphosphate synthase
MSDETAVVIVPAGGSGRRMGSGTPKQYLPLAGRCVLWHTLSRLQTSDAVAAILLVVRMADIPRCDQLGLNRASFPKIRGLVAGGEERWQSVREGLRQTAPRDEIILVHDAVRPFVSSALLSRVVRSAAAHGAAVAAVRATQTIKEGADGRITRTLPRDGLWMVQTPQGFHRQLLLDAYAGVGMGCGVTDDAMLVERMGQPVSLVDGDPQNLKITTPEDMEWAEYRLLRERKMGQETWRVGQGYDVHALAAGRELVLGGVRIPHARGLTGHSDADVLIHAIIDALLGAVASGDIGRLFPDSDPLFAGISSLVLLGRTRACLAEKGARIVNVDAVVMAQQPRLAPYIAAMTATVAETLGVDVGCISIKATTTEHLGFVGREEGIAAQAVALVSL